MQLKRAVYHLAGKDYEQNDMVEFTFHLQRVSINNFLNIELYENYPNFKVRNLVKSFGREFFNDHQHTTTDGKLRSFVVKCSAAHLFLLLNKIGIKEWHSVENMELYVRKGDLRAYEGVIDSRYAGIYVFNPKTKSGHFTSNVPKRIIGRQAIINGKLWRKYYDKNPNK